MKKIDGQTRKGNTLREKKRGAKKEQTERKRLKEKITKRTGRSI